MLYKQQAILDFIRQFVAEKNRPPTIRDIVTGCGVSSTSVVDYHLNVLEKKGFLRRHREISRGIELTDAAPARSKTEVPIIGSIAAGEPIPVPSPDSWDSAAVSETIEVAENLTRGREGVYALRVKGSSMMDALINDGDIVLMQHVDTVENGEMAAVWLKAEREATLKKVFLDAGRVRLQPANSQMQPIYADPDNVEIQGKVIAVVRQLG